MVSIGPATWKTPLPKTLHWSLNVNRHISVYSTGVGFIGHGVGESNKNLMALIGSVDAFSRPGILIPSSNGELLRWCLDTMG